MSTGEYLTKVRTISNYLEYEFTTNRDEASPLNDFDSDNPGRDAGKPLHRVRIGRLVWGKLPASLGALAIGPTVNAGQLVETVSPVPGCGQPGILCGQFHVSRSAGQD